MPIRYPQSRRLAAVTALLLSSPFAPGRAQLRGDPPAVRLADRLIDAIGGRAPWAAARSISVDLRGRLATDPDPWIERYWVDLVVPRGRYQIRIGASERVIAWTASAGWESDDGEVTDQSPERHALEQAFWAAELTVLFRRLAAAAPATRVTLDSTAGGLATLTMIDPSGGDSLATLTLNASAEPIRWSARVAGRSFDQVLGPLARYQSVSLPVWGASTDGLWRYDRQHSALSAEPPPVSFDRPSNAGSLRPSQMEAGLRGDSAAKADARAMVEQMGGLAIWRELGGLHFVHEWDLWSRPDRYLEHEILDLTAPRSYVTMESEVYRRVRAYSEAHRYWNVVNGDFSYATDGAWQDALERAPFSLYRIARGVAVDDSNYAVRFGPMPGVPGATALEFLGPDDLAHGWILLNERKEPMVWATTQYSYALGPLERYGNVRVPRWGATGAGRVRYEMVSLTASRERPDSTLFVPPSQR